MNETDTSDEAAWRYATNTFRNCEMLSVEEAGIPMWREAARRAAGEIQRLQKDNVKLLNERNDALEKLYPNPMAANHESPRDVNSFEDREP